METGKYALALAILIGSIVSATILGNSLINMKMQGRSVEVRGLAERQVKADSAIWVIPINTADDDLVKAQTKIEADIVKIMAFLKKYNIAEEEVSQRSIRVFDKLAQRYSSDTTNKARYLIEAEVVVKSDKIDNVVKASQNINELIIQNITVAYDEYRNNGPRFFFTKLNDIKPEMLAQSIKQARIAAEEFSVNSGSKIGKIKNASQGVFSISSKEASSGANQSYGGDEAYFVEKTVRVLTRVEYYLED